ncbi:MAG TPA: hypothetical protein VII66_00720 [Gemmatimonadaceae bacterium]
MRLPITILAAFIVAGMAAACSIGTETGPSPVNISGAWRYTALQQAPTQSSISGTLTVTDQAGTTFDGSFDAIEVLPDGSSRRLLGPVHGQTLDASTLDFDVMLDVSRRHVAVIRGDTAAGNWLAESSSVTAAGSFQMVRIK